MKISSTTPLGKQNYLIPIPKKQDRLATALNFLPGQGLRGERHSDRRAGLRVRERQAPVQIPGRDRGVGDVLRRQRRGGQLGRHGRLVGGRRQGGRRRGRWGRRGSPETQLGVFIGLKLLECVSKLPISESTFV